MSRFEEGTLERHKLGTAIRCQAMVEKVKEELLGALRERLAAKGISPFDDFSQYPVGRVREDSVPFIGNVHIPAGRVASKLRIDRQFRLLKR